jgi:hypothetical protein
MVDVPITFIEVSAGLCRCFGFLGSLCAIGNTNVSQGMYAEHEAKGHQAIVSSKVDYSCGVSSCLSNELYIWHKNLYNTIVV